MFDVMRIGLLLTLCFSTFEWNFELLYGDKFHSFHPKKVIKLISNVWNKRFAKKDSFLYNPSVIIDNHIIYRCSSWLFSMFLDLMTYTFAFIVLKYPAKL